MILSGCPISEEMHALLREVHQVPHPNRVILVASPDQQAPLYTHNPSLLNYRPKPSAVETAKRDETAKAVEKDEGPEKTETDKVVETEQANEKVETAEEDETAKSAETLKACEEVKAVETASAPKSAKAYICNNFVCILPVTKPEQLRENLQRAFVAAD